MKTEKELLNFIEALEKKREYDIACGDIIDILKWVLDEDL